MINIINVSKKTFNFEVGIMPPGKQLIVSNAFALAVVCSYPNDIEFTKKFVKQANRQPFIDSLGETDSNKKETNKKTRKINKKQGGNK